ncbi:hypothetical protein EZV62_021645 [Acer yangbiense]|uniref:Bulb-type lectin domain-containing protein n=1 Tax=Acer yangbiense TaxID=1000413 RepID=A0A5C7H8J6_9ROSI|nr:hypothetical protein EZV62_021645 [Acer yangbiense]
MDISISFLFLLLLQTPISSSKTFDNNILRKGSSLSVEKSSDQLISPNGVYSAGFFSVGDNAFSFAVWFTKSSPPTVAWMANRDIPVNGKGSKLSLLKNGDLSLTDATGIHIWNSKTFSGNSQPTQLVLSDTGNLVLCTLENVPRLLWQSFDSPTDTLLPEQPFANSSTQLVSSRSQGNCSSGFYKFFFDDDNVLRLLYTGPLISSVYWPLLWKGINLWDLGRTTYNNSRIAVFDTSGFFKSSDNYTFKPSDFGMGPQRRLTLDYDGNLRMYSLVESTGKWDVSWQLQSNPCRIHGVCGPNSLCTYDLYNGRTCSCLPGFKIKNHTDWSYGCELESKINCNRTRVDFLRIPNVDFWGYDIRYIPNSTTSQCQKECMKLCDCKGFMLRFVEPRGVHDCFPKFLLINGHRSPEFNGIVYIKLPKDGTLLFSNNNKTQNVSTLDCSGLGKSPTGTLSFDHGGLIAHGRLVTWVKEKMNKAAAATRDHSWVEEIFDPSLGCDYDINKMEVLVRVALLCLEEDKDSRPTMRQVVEMLASLQ